MSWKKGDFVHNKDKSGGEPRLKLGGHVLVAVGVIFLAVGVWWFGRAKVSPASITTTTHVSTPIPTPTSSPTPTTPSNYVPPTLTSRNTCVYTVVDASNKVHRAITEDADVRIVGLVGRGEAIVEANEAGRARLAANPRLTVGGTPGKTFKDVPLRAGELTVTPLRTEDLELIERVVKANGGTVRGRCGVDENPDLRIVATGETIAALMALPEARWIENYERPVLLNYNAARKIHVAECWPRSAGDDCGTAGLGLTGDGQLVTTCDTGVDTGDMETMHPDLKPNLVGFARTYPAETKAYGQNKHGTHTAGSIVGTGAMSDGMYKGMAYGAKLWAWFGGYHTGSGILPRDSIGENFRPTNQKSYNDYCAANGIVANIFSGSYGGGTSSSYTSGSRSIDDYCWRNPDFLPCFAAGNYYGSYRLSDPASAKNALTVGASENDSVAGYGSKGPTKDERIKPDVVAPGSVTSCNTVGSADGPVQLTNNYYRAEAGTSMSTPLTAGTCALVREWLVKLRGYNETDRKPSSALIKAILMGGATDLGAAKSAQGAGRVNLRNSIAPEDGRTVFLADYIPFEEGMTNAFYLTVTSMSQLDVQLVWVDYPGTPNEDKTTPMLVNDLDLRVESLSFPRTLWVGNGGGVDEQLHIVTDHLNNAESVHIKTLPAGRYRIMVIGDNIPHPSTEGGAAALYVKGAFDASLIRMRDRIPPAVYFQ